ncbi:MAG: dihydrofolate reductase family protein [Melioribacteraceae bacterium]|nr:dihydrofolate reductase family protein [Melioribacteraceae bacterium]
MANIVYIATSIDGYIAKKDGGLDWLNEIPNRDESDFGFKDFMGSIDAIIMGRNTFEIVLSFGEWPYIKPVFVLSNTLQAIPENLKDKAEILTGSPESIIKEMNSRKYFNLYIDGGKTIQEFLKHDLIDELIITRIPILLGEGIPLFDLLTKEQKYEHIKTDIFNNSLVKSHYKRLKN